MAKIKFALYGVGLLLISHTAQAQQRVLSVNLTGLSNGEYNLAFQSPLTEITGYAIFTSYAKSLVPDYVQVLTGGNAVAPVWTFAPDYRRYFGENFYIGVGLWLFVDPNTSYLSFNGSTGYEMPLTDNLIFTAYARYNHSQYSRSLFYGTSIGFLF